MRLSFASCVFTSVLCAAWTQLAAARAGKCPLKKCRAPAAEAVSLLEVRSRRPDQPLDLKIGSATPIGPSQVAPDGTRLYDAAFLPGNFTCHSCDVEVCPGCGFLCKACTGEFFTQECWCRPRHEIAERRPLWKLRASDHQFVTTSGVYRDFCDPKCGIGNCQNPDLVCKPREEACKPWWWCNLPPPKEDNLHPTDGWDDGFFHVPASERVLLEESSEVVRVAKGGNAALRALARASEAVPEGAAATVESNDIGELNFKPAKFVCAAAALPPKIRDPQTLRWVERGYLILDAATCTGSVHKTQCACWDEFRRGKGLDARVTDLLCDKSCTDGACSGKTCGTHYPGEVLRSTASAAALRLDPVEIERRWAEEARPAAARKVRSRSSNA